MSRPNKILQDGALIAGQFRLGRELGRGGMGTVWAAEDLRLARPVAIKFLSNDYFNDQQARQRFEREPRLAGKIRSPHVVQVYAEGTTSDGIPYLVMELLEGEDLSARIARQGKCTLVEAGAIVDQICRALSRAHREGLVHRDIKPHNIFLTPEDDDQVFVKLLDFGIAKDVGAPVTALTLTGEVMGSALYISPEQLREPHTVGPSADIWALGVVIYEMLTARVPFEGNTMHEVFFRLTEGRFTPASELSRALPSDVDAFLSKAIQPDRSLRFSSVDELGSAFARIVRAHSSGLLTRPSAKDSGPPVAHSSAPAAALSGTPASAGLVAQANRPSPDARVPGPQAATSTQLLWRSIAGAMLVVLLAVAAWFVAARRDVPAPLHPVFEAKPAPAPREASLTPPVAQPAPPTAASVELPSHPRLEHNAAQSSDRLPPERGRPNGRPGTANAELRPSGTTPKPNRNYGF
jgi:serine/threonine protein kinase